VSRTISTERLDGIKGLTARFDVINPFDEKYEIRDGTGVGLTASGQLCGNLGLVIAERRGLRLRFSASLPL
jgi:hypothetical protein